MKKTHEKSRIYTVVGTAKLKNPEKVVLQIEATGQRNGDGFIYLVETVSAEDYDRTTAEKELKEYKEAFFETTDNLNAEKEALEELLEQARDAGRDYRRKLDEATQENAELYKALTECRRIFGELPPEIERLLNDEEGEKDHGYTCTI
jgi:sulfatase maturation enzyme AslB (radical SAM superfamily)